MITCTTLKTFAIKAPDPYLSSLVEELVKPSDHENLPFIGSSLALRLVGRFLSMKDCGLFRLRVSACPISSPISPSESESTTRKGCFITLTDFSFLGIKSCFFKLDLFLLKEVGAFDLPVMHVKNNDIKELIEKKTLVFAVK